MKSLLMLFLFVPIVYSSPLLLIIDQDTIKLSSDSIVVFPDSTVIIEYGCNDKSFKNPSVVIGWGKVVNARDTTNGLIFVPSKEDLNTFIYFTIALESNGNIYDMKTILFVVKKPSSGIINIVNGKYKKVGHINTGSYNVLGRKLIKLQVSKLIVKTKTISKKLKCDSNN